MRLPVVLSPYLRPIATPDGFAVDNGVTARVERLDPVEQDVVRAMWDDGSARGALDAVYGARGAEALSRAVLGLCERAVLFTSREECEAAMDDALDARQPPVPFVDQVELTNICPFKCGFCPRGVPGKMKRPTGKMDLALFEKLLDQLHPGQARYRPLELHHLGESLVHPEVDRFVAAASARGLPTEMSCNPSMLTPDLAARLLDAGLRRLVVSLDGMDHETSVAIRGPAARYDRAERHLDALLDMVAAMASPPAVVIQMIDLARNAHQREAFLARWGATGVPAVTAYVKDLDGPDPDTGSASVTPTRYLCTYPWRSVVVLWDGRVVPCCRDADADYVLGDLTTERLADIWNGPRARALRGDLRANTVPCGHLCDGCAWRRDAFAGATSERHPDRAKPAPLGW